ncbi:MAG: hypothetical protein Q8M94_10265 [Ignavibacteria bacterium]|nr:hypothetical protein [Ignavibacteria bacterium]
MKNLVSLFAVLFLFALTSCSDVNDNSFLTNPVMEKSIASGSDIQPAPVYPYPYLFSFSKVKELKYTTTEGENSIEFYLPENGVRYLHLFVVVNSNIDPIHSGASKMFYVDKISDYSFKVEGVVASQVQKISVYGLEVNTTDADVNYPFTNNSTMNEVAVSTWKTNNKEVVVECAGIWPSSLKYVFAELETKHGNFLVFLQRPYSSNFVIPEYGKYGVGGLKLFGYQTVMEGTLPRN